MRPREHGIEKGDFQLIIYQLVNDENVIIASSTSSFPESIFPETTKHRDQVIVAHSV